MKRIRRIINRRHRNKWLAGGFVGMLGGATSLLRFIPESWPAWVGLPLTLAAFAAVGVAGVAHFVDPGDGD